MLDAVDVLLAPVDPVRGLGWVSRELGRLAELDPKLRAARAMVEVHLQGLDQADVTDTLGPVLWVQAREVLRRPQGLAQLRAAFNDGGAVLQAVEEALATALRPEVLHEVIVQARSATDDSAPARVLAQARTELQQASSQLEVTFVIPPPVAVIVVVGIIAIAAIAIAAVLA